MYTWKLAHLDGPHADPSWDQEEHCAGRQDWKEHLQQFVCTWIIEMLGEI